MKRLVRKKVVTVKRKRKQKEVRRANLHRVVHTARLHELMICLPPSLPPSLPSPPCFSSPVPPFLTLPVSLQPFLIPSISPSFPLFLLYSFPPSCRSFLPPCLMTITVIILPSPLLVRCLGFRFTLASLTASNRLLCLYGVYYSIQPSPLPVWR